MAVATKKRHRSRPHLRAAPNEYQARVRFVAKSPAKVGVECPHCGFQQQEYAATKSTLCRQCGRHFIVVAASTETKEIQAPEVAAGGQSFLRRLEGMWNRSRITSVACFDCGATQELNSAATSTICPSCSVHMDLQDYKINTSFSRSIRTHGDVHITATGDLSSSSLLCRCAIIDGKLRGSLQCVEKAEFRGPGKINGKLIARQVLIGRKANVQFYRRLQAGSVEVRGKMSGEILADTDVTIRSTGSLEGNVTARSINVEKGGTFTGQLVIGRQRLEQAELLPGAEGAKNSPRGTRRRPQSPFGLPATS